MSPEASRDIQQAMNNVGNLETLDPDGATANGNAANITRPHAVAATTGYLRRLLPLTMAVVATIIVLTVGYILWTRRKGGTFTK